MSILNEDIISLLNLDNFSHILLKNTSKYLSTIITYSCNDCSKIVDKIVYCSLCNKWFCKLCNYVHYYCVDCNTLICMDCYIEDLYNCCLQCKLPLCKNHIKKKCFYCNNPVCSQHPDYIELCLHCKQYVCKNCMYQLIKCSICKLFFNTKNCMENICPKCKLFSKKF